MMYCKRKFSINGFQTPSVFRCTMSSSWGVFNIFYTIQNYKNNKLFLKYSGIIKFFHPEKCTKM